jgi:hypothetical protein
MSLCDFSGNGGFGYCILGRRLVLDIYMMIGAVQSASRIYHYHLIYHFMVVVTMRYETCASTERSPRNHSLILSR